MRRLAAIGGAAILALLGGRLGSPGIVAAVIGTALYWRALEGVRL
jgi:hypothetical protein